MGTIAIIDSQIAGISGDMLLSCLVDAGANKTKVIDAIFATQDFLKGSKIISANFIKTKVHHFNATRFRFRYKKEVLERKGMEIYRSLASCCNFLDLEQRAKTFALQSLKTIIEAESIIHGDDLSNVQLHESSQIDLLVDLIGSAIALQDLRLFGCPIFSTKVAIGGGILKFSHGVMPNPGSAILQIFKNKSFTLLGGQAEDEMTTPTGAAMLVNLTAGSTDYYPHLMPEKIGYGAGNKNFKNVPNITRVVIGKTSLTYQVNMDTVYVIETNIDDVSGEIIGNLIGLLTAAGAKDTIAIPGITKKNRPTYLIKVISDQAEMNKILQILFSESGTIGVRVQEAQRYILPRVIVTVPVNINDYHFNIRVKITKDFRGKIINTKPEFEDIKMIASQVGIPVKKTMELTMAEVIKRVG
jgi:pyridinium-3,5-bisthiocarboxylic acid mononucleotide nickel chelatase